MDQTRITPLLPEHWPEVARIFKEGMETGLASLETQIPEWPDWDKNHLRDVRFVLLEDKKIIGWAALTPVSHRCVYGGVAEISIYMDARFQGRGFGTKLLQHTVKSSEKAGFWTLQAMILEENKASIRLHEKAGFRVVGIREKIGKRNGEWKNIVLMERRSPLETFA